MAINPQVLITGATGFVGHAVAAELHRASIPAVALVRNPDSEASVALSERYGIGLRKGDITDHRSLPAALQGVSQVIHLVGIISEAGQVTFENVHARGTERLVTSATAAGGRRFVHMSALGTRPDAVSRYHQTKWAAEQAVRASPLEWTIFRPSLIYGPGDHFISLFARMARFSPVLPVPGSGRSKFAPVHIEPVAKAFVKALSERRAIGQTFDLCGPEEFTLPGMLRQLLLATGRRRAVMRLPLALARAQAQMLEFTFGKILHKPPPLSRDQLVMLEENNTGNGAPADALFGLEHPRFSEAIRGYNPD
jgi:uncharacterized protein YbjT (DUF2867 family)